MLKPPRLRFPRGGLLPRSGRDDAGVLQLVTDEAFFLGGVAGPPGTLRVRKAGPAGVN